MGYPRREGQERQQVEVGEEAKRLGKTQTEPLTVFFTNVTRHQPGVERTDVKERKKVLTKQRVKIPLVSDRTSNAEETIATGNHGRRNDERKDNRKGNVNYQLTVQLCESAGTAADDTSNAPRRPSCDGTKEGCHSEREK